MVATDEREFSDGSHVSGSPKLDVEPNEIFKRMVINDKKQNQRITANLSKSNGAKLSPESCGKDAGIRRTKVRFVVCTLGLLALSVSQMSRMILNQSIKDMVDPSMLKKDAHSVSTEGSCPWPQEEVQEQSSTPFDIILTTLPPSEPSTLTPSGPSTELPSEPSIELPNEPSTDAYQPHEDSVDEFIGGGNDDDDDDDDIQGDEPKLDSELPSRNVATSASSPELIETIHIDRFLWTMEQQSYLLGGFFYGYAVFMIPGGRLAEMYGAKYVILLSTAGSGLINLATPWMARNSFPLLVMSRVLLGIIQSGIFPAMYALFAKWLTPTETSLFAPLIKLNLRLGMFFGSLLPGLLADWPNVFYFTGIVCAVLSLLWLLISSSGPEGNDWVNESELAHIMRKKRKPKLSDAIEMTTRTVNDETQSKQVKVKIKSPKENTPWLKILTNPSVIGLILVKVTFNFAVDFFSILVPSYLAYVHHASKETVSLITTIMFSLQIALIVLIGWLAKTMITRKPFGLSKTAIRKIFQVVSNWGMALSLILLTFNDCMILYVAILLQLMSLLSMFTAGGETMLPYDLSDQYPATIMAIANSVANFSGVITTFLSGVIVGDKSGSYDRWNILMYLIAGANILGGLAFVLLVKAEPIDFTKSRSRNKREDIEAPSSGELRTTALSEAQDQSGQQQVEPEPETAESATARIAVSSSSVIVGQSKLAARGEAVARVLQSLDGK